ncbi:MAG TPA: MtrB/PioB family decaheme-associated outer membrane protein [Ramlibacter sp.]|nr:MtrB/PioB family decaheme-associated outer membrane protein [Ramlibacter sp.]
MNPPRTLRARPTILAVALLAALASWQAHADEAASSVTLGLGVVNGDRSQFDQYRGLRPGSFQGLAAFDYYRRDDASGRAVLLEGTDLASGNRELGLRWKRQGDWKFSADYREGVRHETAVVNSGTGSDFDLKVKRTGLGFAFSKLLSRDWQFDASVQSENKEGARLFGIGMNCPSAIAPGCRGTTGTEAGWAVLMVPEPVSSNHSQLEARVSYAGEKLHLSGGYYGSFYRNEHGALRAAVPASLNNPLGTTLPLSAGLQSILNQPVALPPDNQAHHLDLTGNYAFTNTTRLNFKLGYSQATQHQDFASAGFSSAPAGISDLGGKLTTTLAQVGMTARPMPKLSLLGNVRYEHRADSTPIAPYNLEGTSTYTNHRLPLTKVRGKLQASYQITNDWRGSVGADIEKIDRGVFTATSAISGITALRQETEETGVRAELRRRMSDDLSGAVSVESSRRNGSNWLRDNSGLGVTEVPDPTAASTGFATGIFMPTLADRKRDKARLHVDWQANEKLSLQFVAEGGRDRFDTPSPYGLRSAGMGSAGMDWTYAASETLNFTGFVSRGRQELDQARPDAAIIAFDNTTTSIGAGFTSKPMANLEVGGGVSYHEDRSVHAQTLDATADAGSAALLAATGGLPDIVFAQATLKLFGKYTLSKQSSVRVDLIFQRTKWNDWAWGYNGTPFVYSDGTTIVRKPVQNAAFVGVSYTHRWP